MKALVIVAGIFVALFAAGIGGLYWVQNSPTIAAEAVLQENRHILNMCAHTWGCSDFRQTEQVAVLDRGNGYYQAFYRTEKPEWHRCSLFSITIKKEDGLWKLKRGPALASEVK